MKTTFPAELLVPIDRASDVPLHTQLERYLRHAVQTGRIPAHTSLPSTRSLAADLHIARGVVVECYEQLTAEGYFTSRAGSGTRVAAIRAQALRMPVDAPVEPAFGYDFIPGIPDASAFPRAAWLACLRRAFKNAQPDAFHYPELRGPRVTRIALASHLARSRATVGGEERVVLCSGFAQGIDLVARLLRSKGVKTVAIEDPGFGALRRRFQEVGIGTECVPLDDRGLVVERLKRTSASVVVVTPAHQFPTGAGMTPDRRGALLAWAARCNGLIIEDDYDAEYRYDREPLGALQGLAPDRVIYIGTASKILSPALRLGWMLAPEGVATELARLKRRIDGGPPTLDQLALAQFFASGEMDRHLRRMRQVYHRRRDLLIDALREFFPDLRVRGVAAGLHLMLDLPKGSDEREVLRAAESRSIRIFGASRYRIRTAGHDAAIVLGYGCIEEALLREGVQALAGCVADAARPRARTTRSPDARRSLAAGSERAC